jgi:hypothetical protein
VDDAGDPRGAKRRFDRGSVDVQDPLRLDRHRPAAFPPQQVADAPATGRAGRENGAAAAARARRRGSAGRPHHRCIVRHRAGAASACPRRPPRSARATALRPRPWRSARRAGSRDCPPSPRHGSPHSPPRVSRSRRPPRPVRAAGRRRSNCRTDRPAHRPRPPRVRGRNRTRETRRPMPVAPAKGEGPR